MFQNVVICFRFQVSSFKFQVSGFRFQVSGFRFQVSSFKFQVSGFKFKVSGLKKLVDCTICTRDSSGKPAGRGWAFLRVGWATSGSRDQTDKKPTHGRGLAADSPNWGHKKTVYSRMNKRIFRDNLCQSLELWERFSGSYFNNSTKYL